MLYTIRNITEERLLALKYELLDQWTMESNAVAICSLKVTGTNF